MGKICPVNYKSDKSEPLSLENPLSPSYGSVYSLLKTGNLTVCTPTRWDAGRHGFKLSKPHLQGGKPKLNRFISLRSLRCQHSLRYFGPVLTHISLTCTSGRAHLQLPQRTGNQKLYTVFHHCDLQLFICQNTFHK